MKNRHNRAQIQCPSCGTWNNSDASICGECGRILQVREKPPVDYRRLMPLILVAVSVFVAVSFWGYLQFTIYDAQRKIENQDYEAAANELMKISFYGKADELLKLPEIENYAFVGYARAKKLYREKDYVGAMEKLVPIEMYEDSSELLRKYAREFLEGSWSEQESEDWGIFFSTFSVSAFSVQIWDNNDDYDYNEMIVQNMSFWNDETGLMIEMEFDDDAGNTMYYDFTNMTQDYLELNGIKFKRN